MRYEGLAAGRVKFVFTSKLFLHYKGYRGRDFGRLGIIMKEIVEKLRSMSPLYEDFVRKNVQ